MVVVVVAPDSGFLDSPVHSLDLPVGPWMIDLGEAVLDAVFPTAHGKHVGHEPCRWTIGVARREAELDAVAGQDGVNLSGNSCDQIDEEARRRHPRCLLDELQDGELAGAIDGNEEVELAFNGLHFCNVDVKETDRVCLELASGWFVAFDLKQPADTVTLQAAVQRGAQQVRDRCLQRVEAIIKRQRSTPAECHDDGLLLH
jgi:hypothetical protein